MFYLYIYGTYKCDENLFIYLITSSLRNQISMNIRKFSES